MNSMPIYDDDDEEECGDTCLSDVEYGSYEKPITLSFEEVYDSCIEPSVIESFWYFIPLIIASFFCNIAAQINFMQPKIFHVISSLSGVFVIWYYAPEAQWIVGIFLISSYNILSSYNSKFPRICIYSPCLGMLLYCEFCLVSKDWHKIRGVTMILLMKYISFTVDFLELNQVQFLDYSGYMLCSSTCLFGPWISFNTYKEIYQRSWNITWSIIAAGYMLLAYFFLSISNCWTNWILDDSLGKWLIAYRDALAFRSSHYFVSFFSSSLMLFGGFPLSQTIITKPLEIELPRSLVQVVIWWNVPMHYWLKTYIFRPVRTKFGNFFGIIMTYLASSLLHGLNFQLAAVLLSLGFYTYIEFKLRQLLATEFSACIEAKKCSKKTCSHSKTSSNTFWVNFINIAFTLLAIFHLTYLGLMFDTSESQESGYSYAHTIRKWSELNFSSHWVAICMYGAYFLIR